MRGVSGFLHVDHVKPSKMIVPELIESEAGKDWVSYHAGHKPTRVIHGIPGSGLGMYLVSY